MFNEADADKMTFQMSLFFKGSQYHRQTGSLYVLSVFFYIFRKKKLSYLKIQKNICNV